MRTLKRLKDLLTGEEDGIEKKEGVKEAAKTETPATVEVEKSTESVDAENLAEKKPEEPSESVKEEAYKPSETVPTLDETVSEEKELESQVEVEEKPKPERSENMTLLNKAENKLTREDVDEDFKQQIMDAGAESLALCFQCGTCTGACPSGRRTPYRIRQIIRKSLMGLKEDVISDDTLWMCSTCYECQERCPRKIKIVDVVKTARNFAAQAGYMGPAHKAVGSFVIKTGHGVPINDATMDLRKRVGLTELPPTTHEYPEALEEVQKILKKTGFDSLIGYNWESGELE